MSPELFRRYEVADASDAVDRITAGLAGYGWHESQGSRASAAEPSWWRGRVVLAVVAAGPHAVDVWVEAGG